VFLGLSEVAFFSGGCQSASALSSDARPGFPVDWPASGAIDLTQHDLPHASSSTEWWYLNAHLEAAGGRRFSLFAAFFRIINGKRPDGSIEHAHSLTWALTDHEKQDYVARSFVDPNAPRIGLERIKKGQGAKDERLNRAVSEVLERGKVPLPDRFFPSEVKVATDRLALDYGSATFEKTKAGEYRLTLRSNEGPRSPVSAELTFELKKPPIRHGNDGVVHGVHGEDMFYVFVPRCDVRGSVTLDGVATSVMGAGWYDHEFGAHREQPKGHDTKSDLGVIAWNWVSAQLDDGSDVSVYELVHSETGEDKGRWAVLIDAEGQRHAFTDFTLGPRGMWRSVRTFEKYPTGFSLRIPGAKLELEVDAVVADQELVTVISKPAFWEGACTVKGAREGRAVGGRGFVERSGFFSAETLDDFFKSVGEAVRDSVQAAAPLTLTRAHAEKLVAAPGREDVLDGVDLKQLARTLIAPVREITDRGGKSWRSYAALACCDVVLGDSRKFAEWLAFPEFIHVGSLIVDDVQDRSEIRRGGKASHLIHGEAIAINAGTAAYFMGERLLRRSLVSDTAKLELYDLYFEALREGHAGQAIDLDGLDAFVGPALDSGDFASLEKQVLAIHRLKTAAPASALARMGGVAGGGTRAQIEAVGRYFDALGLAFQIVDDVLNLRGFKGDLKTKAEDLTHGKVTMPVARAFSLLKSDAERRRLWCLVAMKSNDFGVLSEAVGLIERCGALDGCMHDAKKLVEDAWSALTPLVEDSLAKVMLRAFGWYVLERHY
jgi:geranylgeranyl pyrophosphate synthase/predicted secreted hydrolase